MSAHAIIYKYPLYINQILASTDINIVAVRNISCKNCTGSVSEFSYPGFIFLPSMALRSYLHCQFVSFQSLQSMPSVAEGPWALAVDIFAIANIDRAIQQNIYLYILFIYFMIKYNCNKLAVAMDKFSIYIIFIK